MAQELTIIKTDNGRYIVKQIDTVAQRQALQAFTNFGAVVKEARVLFDEIIVHRDTDVEVEQTIQG